jgi:hypothetical protein
MIFLTLLTALLLSGVAGYYSVIGLAAIFPGSFWPIIIMGSTLEAAKLVTVSWLYRNWKFAPIGMKAYLTAASVILMLITSMGIFGYLSKAHLEHSADTAPLAMKVQLLDEKIRIAKENINEDRKALKQMDEAVDQIMGRSTDEKGADKAVAVRKQQTKERTRLLSNIEAQQKVVAQYTDERSPLSIELSKAESDFGPIKYVAELIYGDGDGIIDKAVRLVIMLIMVVFDPLAVLLLIAANMSLKEREGLNDVQNFFNRAKENARKLDEEAQTGFVAQEVAHVVPEAVLVEDDANTGNVSISTDEMFALVVEAAKELNKNHEEPVDPHAYLKQPFVHFKNLKPMVAKPETDVLPEETKQETLEIKRDNMIVIDDVTGETIPPITHEKIEVHLAPGLHEEHHVPIEEVPKKLEPKYDYDAPYSFKEKKLDGGDF